ncbi:Hypothetical predicted protein, partial [Marmota monax]
CQSYLLGTGARVQGKYELGLGVGAVAPGAPRAHSPGIRNQRGYSGAQPAPHPSGRSLTGESPV